MYTVLMALLGTAAFASAQTTQQTTNSKNLPPGFYSNDGVCSEACKGHRDVGCRQAFTNNNGGLSYCACQPGYFNNADQCDLECEDNQFWSLFTYGSCTTIKTGNNFSGVVGSCTLMCSFRVRVWTTVFIIILFFSACVLLVLMLPGFVTSCYTCCALRKQKRRAEEEAAIAAVTDPHGTIVKHGANSAAMHQQAAGWQYPYFGWPSYYGQGRM